MSKEFVVKMRDRFILRGPRECLEDRSGSIHTQCKPTTSEDLTESSNNRTADCQGTLSSLIDQGTLGQKESNNRISDQIEADQEADQTSEAMLLDAMENNNIDLSKSIQGKYGEDLMFELIIKSPKEYRNFEVDDGLVYLKVAGKRLLCIPKLLIDNRSV